MQLEGLLVEKDQVQDQEVAALETEKMTRKMKKQRKKKNQSPSEKLWY